MKKYLLFIVLFAFISCKKSFTASDLVLLNGDWEIAKVELPNGKTNEYSVNPKGERYVFTDGKGSKTKILLSLDGKIKVTSMKTQFVVLDSNSTTYLKNKSEHSTWLESVNELTNDKLVLENEQNILYYYKRVTNE